MRPIDADALKKDWGMANRCEDCPRDARDCQYGMVLTRMDVCDMLDDAPTVGGWISVKERMPDLDEQVLIVYEWTGRSRAKYREIALDSFKAMRFLGYTPLFWMPLPEPPEEVSGDD